jgi:hypothetical protein
MADMENTHHFDGDGCAVFYRGYEVETQAGWRSAEDLDDGDVWRDPATDATDVWWYADDVVVLGGDGDEVHVEYSQA